MTASRPHLPGHSPVAAGVSPYDEMVTGNRRIRSHWEGLVAAIGAFPPGALAERAERAALQFRDDGVTHDNFGAPRSATQSWKFDPIPLVVSAAEWAFLESALVERAELLDAALADLYGPQRLLTDGIYPPGLVYDSPEFLRPCRRAVGTGRHLSFYAADLVREPDGRWMVFADRTQAPAGIGYALEDRQVLGRVLPELFPGSRVRPIQAFFDLWQAALLEMAPEPSDNPRVVLLTPGQFSATFFEQSFLARTLGIPLVEGSDLTVRDGRVHLKTMGGLQRVDVIYRRVDGAFCDSLELRGDSLLGVPGLVEAVRGGKVAVANAIGSALIETPAFQAFVPALARHLLGRELALPTRPTWWCGTPEGRAQVRDRLGEVVMRAAFMPNDPAIAGRRLDEAAREALRSRVLANPARWVVQADVPPSVAPSWVDSALEPRPVLLRVFLVAYRGSYVVMPGGLARIPEADEPPRATLRNGGISKDVWVVAADMSEAAPPASGGGQTIVLRRSAGELQSRVAENLFWLGRYLERLENGARLFRAGLWRLVGGGFQPRAMAELAGIMRLLHAASLMDEAMVAARPDSRFVAEAMTSFGAPDEPLAELLGHIQALFGSGRDRFSADMWNTANHLVSDSRASFAAAGTDVDKLLAALDGMIRGCAAFAGVASENMTRGTGWRAFDIGRRVERGIHITQSLHALWSSAGANADVSLRLALELCDSTITYRTRYLAAMRPAPVIDLVAMDDTNPRSVAYQLERLCSSLAALPAPASAHAAGLELATPARLLARLRSFDPTTVKQMDRDPAMDRFIDMIREVHHGLMVLSDSIARAYFSLVAPPHAVGISREVA